MHMIENQHVKIINDGLHNSTSKNSWSCLLLNRKEPYISSIQNYTFVMETGIQIREKMH